MWFKLKKNSSWWAIYSLKIDIQRKSSKAHWALSWVMSESSSLRKMTPIRSSPACNLDWKRNLSNLPLRMMSRLLLPNWKSKKLSHLISKRKRMSHLLLKSPKPKLKHHPLKMIKRSQLFLKLRNQKPKTAIHLFRNLKIS